MAHARFVAAALALLTACSDPAPRRAEGPIDLAVKPTKAPAFTADDGSKWAKFHSKRFNVTVSLPDGKAWKIDDHRAADMVAVHDATTSRLSLRATIEEGLMNRQRCEERGRALGVVPIEAEKKFTTVEDAAWVGPDAYDSRVWVAIEAAKPGGAVTGHVFLFGSYIRNCLLVHLTTTVPSGKDEEILATRLAVAEERIVKAIAIGPSRTSEDADVPKERPEIRR